MNSDESVSEPDIAEHEMYLPYSNSKSELSSQLKIRLARQTQNFTFP